LMVKSIPSTALTCWYDLLRFFTEMIVSTTILY
jgi:hypothetical protein